MAEESRGKATTSDLIGFGALSASVAAGYGVLFTLIGDFRDAYGISEASLGWVIGIGFIAEFAAMILLAPLGDRGKSRSMVWVAAVVNIVGLLVMAVGTSAWLMGAGRLLSGAAGGAMTPVLRRIVVVRDPANIGRNLGFLISSSIFGFALGPAISSVLAGPFGLAAPFIAVAGLAAISTLWVARSTDTQSLDEAPVPNAGGGEPEGLEPAPRLAFDLLRNRPLIGALCFGAGVYVMIGGFDVLWDVVHEDLGTPNWLANMGISVFALPLIVLSPIGGRLAQSFGPFRIGGLGLVLAALFMFSYGLAPTGNWILGIGIIHALVDGFTIAATGIAVTVTVPEERLAGAQGLLGASQALAAGLIAPVIGVVYQTQGRFSAYGTVTAVMMALVVAGFTLAWPVIRR